MKIDRKNKLLGIGFIVMLYVCYTFAISNTITMYSDYATKKKLIANNSDTPKLTSELKSKEKQLDQFLQQYKVTDSISLQNSLLKELNNYANTFNLKVIDFKEPHAIVQNNQTTTSYVFSLKGSFNECLAAINKLENNNNVGFVRHLNFSKKLNYKSNTNELTVEVILQKKSS